jgi:hypothetical protein
MKGLFVTSATNETIKYGESFEYLGHEVLTAKYTNRIGHSGQGTVGLGDEEILRIAKEASPDLIVYIGSRWGDLLSIPALQRLRDIAPTVHICSDAADDPWWDLLIEYDQAHAFDVQVAIDGTKEWPLYDTQVTCLTPFRPDQYPQNPPEHRFRPIAWGYSGNPGGRNSRRKAMMDQMMHSGMRVRWRNPAPGTHQAYIDFMCSCRIISNFPHTGTQKYMHVKGRVVECGMTGAMLLEQAGSPTADWFVPGEDYLEYSTPAQAKEIVDRLEHCYEETQAIGNNLRAKVLERHSPERFWGRILDRVGLPAIAKVAA